MKTTSILNMKGGVGKTTTAINLAYILATEYGQRVLLVDADGQANATQMLLPPKEYQGLAALLFDSTEDYLSLIVPTEISGLDMLPASDDLWSVDLQSARGDSPWLGYTALCSFREALEEMELYDVCIIDCPPSFSTACMSAIQASDTIVIPVLPDAFSAEGMAGLVSQIDGIRQLNPAVRVGGCLINQWHNSDVVHDAVKCMREEGPIPVYETMIRRTDKVIESTWAGQSVLMWSPYSSASRDFRVWAREFVAKEGLDRGQV